MLPFSCDPIALKKQLMALAARRLKTKPQKATLQSLRAEIDTWQDFEAGQQNQPSAADLWDGAELEFVANAKERTKELHERTLALLEKSDHLVAESTDKAVELDHAPEERHETVALDNESAVPEVHGDDSIVEGMRTAGIEETRHEEVDQPTCQPAEEVDVDVDLPGTDESPLAVKIRSIRARLRERAAAHTAPPSGGIRRRKTHGHFRTRVSSPMKSEDGSTPVRPQSVLHIVDVKDVSAQEDTDQLELPARTVSRLGKRSKTLEAGCWFGPGRGEGDIVDKRRTLPSESMRSELSVTPPGGSSPQSGWQRARAITAVVGLHRHLVKSKDIGREMPETGRQTLRRPLSSFTEQLNEMQSAARRRMIEEQKASMRQGQEAGEGNESRRMSVSLQSNLRGLFNMHKQTASKEEDAKRNLFDDTETTFRQRDLSPIAGQYNMELPAVDTLYDWFERLQPERVVVVPPTPPTWSPRRRRRRSSVESPLVPKELWSSERSEGSSRNRVQENAKAPLEIAKALGDPVDEDATRFRNFMQELLKTNPEVQQMTSAWEIRKFIRARQNETLMKIEAESDGD